MQMVISDRWTSTEHFFAKLRPAPDQVELLCQILEAINLGVGAHTRFAVTAIFSVLDKKS